MITYQAARNTYLQNEIKILDKRIAEIKKLEKQKAALVERMKIVEELQASRPGVVHMFDQFVTTLTEGNYLASVTQKGIYADARRAGRLQCPSLVIHEPAGCLRLV
jgi:type IV pilus assembly protein PilN